jgi:hypothetical protein
MLLSIVPTADSILPPGPPQQFFCDPKERLVVVVGTAAPGELRKYYREQIQDIVYGAMVQ